MKNKTWSARVWAGDPSTVAQARRAYKREPDGPKRLIAYAVSLYSFRQYERFAEELLALRPQLLRHAQEVIQMEAAGEGVARARANECDVLSTHLAWMSRRPELRAEIRRSARETAVVLCEKGLKLTVWQKKQGGHTHALLLLTMAELILDVRSGSVDGYLTDVEHAVRRMADAKQKARVTRKLGLLWRCAGSSFRGTEWLLRSIFVSGVPLAVRLKSVAALFGINR